MDPCDDFAGIGEIPSPALIVHRDLLESNIERMIAIAGDPQRLRPHCKTHKMPEVTRLELARGVRKHKCATIAEAEMLAEAGARDVLLAYNLVGPNLDRAVRLVQRYPELQLFATADHAVPIAALGRAASAASCRIGLLLDVDTGLGRTGVPVGEEALRLYRQIAETPGVAAAGLHVYDGHLHQRSREERGRAVLDLWEDITAFRRRLDEANLPVPRIVAGGTGTFPIYAAMADPALELSPGTTVFYDAGYSHAFPDLPFAVAAVLLTRVVSRPARQRMTLDLGTKACAADPPMAQRAVFPGLRDAKIVLHNEEHLVLETPDAERYQPGDALLAIPWHICPTVALHKQAWIVQGGRLKDCWEVIARDRCLTL